MLKGEKLGDVERKHKREKLQGKKKVPTQAQPPDEVRKKNIKKQPRDPVTLNRANEHQGEKAAGRVPPWSY